MGVPEGAAAPQTGGPWTGASPLSNAWTLGLQHRDGGAFSMDTRAKWGRRTLDKGTTFHMSIFDVLYVHNPFHSGAPLP